MGVECSLRARGEVAVLRAPLSLLATPCCLVPRDSSYTILVFLPRTPTVTRAGRRREGREGSGIAHCGHIRKTHISEIRDNAGKSAKLKVI